MLANPSAGTTAILINNHVSSAVVVVVRRPDVGIVKEVAAHNLGESVRMGQHVGDGLLVLPGRLVSDDVTSSTVSALVVVIVHKDEGPVVPGHAPSVIDESAQLAVVVDAPGQFHAVAEFRHQSDVVILVDPNGSVVAVDNFAVDEQFRVGGESVLGRKWIDPGRDGGNILNLNQTQKLN